MSSVWAVLYIIEHTTVAIYHNFPKSFPSTSISRFLDSHNFTTVATHKWCEHWKFTQLNSRVISLQITFEEELSSLILSSVAPCLLLPGLPWPLLLVSTAKQPTFSAHICLPVEHLGYDYGWTNVIWRTEYSCPITDFSKLWLPFLLSALW